MEQPKVVNPKGYKTSLPHPSTRGMGIRDLLLVVVALLFLEKKALCCYNNLRPPVYFVLNISSKCLLSSNKKIKESLIEVREKN